jgi:hypothetical protein
MGEPQPKDEWVFLRTDEFTDDTSLETIDADVEQGPEERAIHVERITRPDTKPHRTAPVPAPPEPPVTYFDDEEPESGPRRAPRGDEREPDLEELLESQHYAFGPGSGE